MRWHDGGSQHGLEYQSLLGLHGDPEEDGQAPRGAHSPLLVLPAGWNWRTPEHYLVNQFLPIVRATSIGPLPLHIIRATSIGPLTHLHISIPLPVRE